MYTFYLRIFIQVTFRRAQHLESLSSIQNLFVYWVRVDISLMADKSDTHIHSHIGI